MPIANIWYNSTRALAENIKKLKTKEEFKSLLQKVATGTGKRKKRRVS